MQDANIVRRGNRLGNINKETQTSIERDVRQASLRVSPFCQVRPGVFAFQREGRRLKVPFQYADKFWPVAKRFPQETRNSDLALQPLQTYAVGREFEYPLFVGLGILRQPDLARA